MSIRIIGAVGRTSARSDAHSIEPWFDVAAFPHSAPGLLSFALRILVLSFGVLRPVQGEAVAHESIPEVHAVDKARRYSATVTIQRDRQAAYWASGNERVQIVRRLRAALVLFAVLAPAQLRALGRIDPPEPNSGAMYFKRVTIDDAGLPCQVIGLSHIG